MSVALSPEALLSTTMPAGVERIAITSREQWLKLLRPHDVTASVAGCLLGLPDAPGPESPERPHDYMTAYKLYLLKTNQIDDKVDVTPQIDEDAGEIELPPAERGNRLEPVMVDLIREIKPRWQVDRGNFYLRDTKHRLGATPDIFATRPDKAGLGIIQMKSVAPMVFARKWRDPDTHETTLPQWIAVQAIIEAHLAGASWACVAALRCDFSMKLTILDIPIHRHLIDRIKEEVADFWARVASGEAPPVDWKRDAELVSLLYPKDNGTEIDLSGDNEIVGLVDQRRRAKDLIKLAEGDAAEAEAQIKAKLGNAAGAYISPELTVRWPLIRRASYVAKASEYRRLAITDKRRAIDHAGF